MAKKRKTKARRPNMLFPGRPNYLGPSHGWFAWIHHGKLFEHTKVSGNSIAARVVYVRRKKPKDERAIRLNHIMYLGAALNRKLTKMERPENNRANGLIIQDVDEARSAVLAYVKKHKPRHRWNDARGTLMKSNGKKMGG